MVVGAIALAAAFSWNCGPRTAKVELGRWLRDRAGPAPVLFGPDGFTQVVNYYAGGHCASFAPTEREETVRTFFAQCRPNVVLLPRDEPPGNNEFVARISAAAGLRPLDCGRLPASCAGVAVWMRGNRPAVENGDRHRRRRLCLQTNRCRGDGASPHFPLPVPIWWEWIVRDG